MINFTDILKECNFKSALSGGPGGQHVNNTYSKLIVKWNINSSIYLNDEQKELLHLKLANLINKNGELTLSVDQFKSQHQNKKALTVKLNQLISNALKKKKKRIPTKISQAAKAKRLKIKRVQAEKKDNRKKIKW